MKTYLIRMYGSQSESLWIEPEALECEDLIINSGMYDHSEAP